MQNIFKNLKCLPVLMVKISRTPHMNSKKKKNNKKKMPIAKVLLTRITSIDLNFPKKPKRKSKLALTFSVLFCFKMIMESMIQ